jgi:hypothetical protein
MPYLRRAIRLPVRISARDCASLSLILICLGVYAVLAARRPYGEWDAWAVWNVRAKVFAHDMVGGLRLPTYYEHTDYPPLLGIVIGLGWRVVGYTPWIPWLVHGALFAGVLWLVRRPWWLVGIVGGIGLEFAAYQYADMALALTTLGAVIAYTHRRFIAVGIWLGIGMLTKNEGSWIALMCTSTWIVWDRRLALPMILALLPFAVLLIGYKLYAGVPSDLVQPGMIGRVFDASRYDGIIPYLVRETIRYGYYVLLWGTALVVLLDIPIRPSPVTLALGLIVVGYLGVYLISPHDLTWHIKYSWTRLLWQVTPAMLYSLRRVDNVP